MSDLPAAAERKNRLGCFAEDFLFANRAQTIWPVKPAMVTTWTTPESASNNNSVACS